MIINHCVTKKILPKFRKRGERLAAKALLQYAVNAGRYEYAHQGPEGLLHEAREARIMAMLAIVEPLVTLLVPHAQHAELSFSWTEPPL